MDSHEFQLDPFFEMLGVHGPPAGQVCDIPEQGGVGSINSREGMVFLMFSSISNWHKS